MDVKADGRWLMSLQGLDKSYEATIRMASQIGQATRPILQEFAKTIQRGSAARIKENQHPSGIFPKKGSPRYRIKKVGGYYYKVETPTGDWGMGTAVAEYAREYTTEGGEIMVGVLNKSYGKPLRVMYHVHDEHEPTYKARFQAAVMRVQAEVDKETS